MAQAAGSRSASPERWRRAAERAINEGIEVRQILSTGQWIATSGSQAGVAYTLDITNGIPRGCDCLAGINNDPCCKHRAAFMLMTGLLDLEPPAAIPVAA